MLDDDKPATDDADIIAECKARFERCLVAYDSDRALALEDLRFRNGEQWLPEEVRQREIDGRPCLTINNLPATLHQVTNDIRQNRQSIHVHPVDDYADEEVAKVIEGMCRHIEYDSGADAAYDTATELAASVGFGFFRLISEYSDPLSFDQDLKIKRIRNPFTVFPDPDAQEADGSDQKFCIITSKMPKRMFKAAYPKAVGSYDGIGTATGDGSGQWLSDDDLRVAEYFRIVEKDETLVLLSDGTTRLATDKSPMPFGVVPQATRPTKVPTVQWFKLTGIEVLERAIVPCPWIPVFPVYGDEVDIDGKVTRSGLIRHAKDPARMYDYWLTAATEEIALRTKTPYIGAIGQFEGVEDDWNSANNRSFSYLEYNPVTIDGTLAPAPQRQPPADVPSGYIAMAGIARDNIKAVTGIYDASLGNRSNETSGIAIRSRQSQGELANFHIADNLTRAIRHLGRCMVAMFPRIYDTERVARILGEDGKATQVPVNKPVKQQTERGVIEKVLNDLTVGKYDVVVSSGPAYATLREEAADQMIAAGQSWPKLWEVAGDKIIGSMDWPHAKDIAERIEKTLPPGLADEDEQDDAVMTPNGPIPKEQAGQLIGQMDQALQAMQAELEGNQTELEKVKMTNESRERIAAMNNEAKLDDSELRGMIQLLIAKVEPLLAHQAAVVAAADPEHPATPAPIAQGVVQSPVAEQAAQMEPQSGAGESAPAIEDASS